MNTKISSIDEYIAGFPKPVQQKLELIRSTVRQAAPMATEKISYGMPTFALAKNLVYFGAFKNHIGFYALPTATKSLENELQKYKSGKGSIQFPLEQDLPIDLIRKLVELRIKELQQHH